MEEAKEYIKGIAIVLGIVIIGFALKGFILGGASSSTQTGNTIIDTDEVQYVTLKFVNYEYVMEPSTLKLGVPAVMTVDLDTVYGCMQDVVIPDYGIRKYVSPGDNIIEFTPTKAGKLPVSCSMGMGRGTLKVA